MTTTDTRPIWEKPTITESQDHTLSWASDAVEGSRVWENRAAQLRGDGRIGLAIFAEGIAGLMRCFFNAARGVAR